MGNKLEFTDRPSVRKNDERTIRTFPSACGRCKVIEIISRLGGGARYWLAARVLDNGGEYPILLPERKSSEPHHYRTRAAAERACHQHLAAKGLLDPQPQLWSDEPMPRKKKSTKTKTKTTKPARAKRAAAAVAKSSGAADGKKLSALDAAAQVLGMVKEPMSAKQMIDAMAAQGLWESPGGKTPDATLYAAIIREIKAKGKEARFKKTERGRFALAS